MCSTGSFLFWGTHPSLSKLWSNRPRFVNFRSMTQAERRRLWVAAVVLAVPLLFAGFCRPWGQNRVPPLEVWRQAQSLGQKHNIEPWFIYAIAFAESSFDAHANNGSARGMMQLTPPAWDTVTNRPFHNAWLWEVNMHAGVRYLVHLRESLSAAGAYNYANLAAAYRYGPNALARSGYDLRKLPQPQNKVYQAIFEGRIPSQLPSPLEGRPAPWAVSAEVAAN